jgi:hypothetical protein
MTPPRQRHIGVLACPNSSISSAPEGQMVAIVPPPASPAGYQEVQRLDLTVPFHTKTPWFVQLMQPIGRDAETGDRPARICFTGGKDAATHCEDIKAEGYGFQTVKSAAVTPLSAKARLSGLEVKAEFSGGSHILSRTDVWTYNGAGLADDFEPTSGFSRSDLGEEERFASGPMDGYYIVADFLSGAGETRWSDHRYSLEVYRLRPDYGGYNQVLQYLSPGTYRSERDRPHEVIDQELPRVRKLLETVYPKGVPER